MRDNNKGKQNGYAYTNNSVKQRIENNEFVKEIRKKLMQERILKLSKNNQIELHELKTRLKESLLIDVNLIFY